MALVKLKMKTAGPNGNYKAGQTVTVDEQRAARLLADGDAEEYTTKKVRKAKRVEYGD